MTPAKALLAPPDVSALTAAERIAVMREYRLKVTAPKTYDFSLGPPDVSELDGAERLKLLREYRHYKEAQAYAAPPSPVPAGRGRAPTAGGVAAAAGAGPPSCGVVAARPDVQHARRAAVQYSATNGTDVNGTVLPYASEVPASPPYKYRRRPTPSPACPRGGRPRSTPFTTFGAATAPPPLRCPPCGRRGGRRGRCCRRRPVRALRRPP